MLIAWGNGSADQYGWQALAVGFVWTAVASVTVVPPPTLNICRTATASLTPRRDVQSVVPVRRVASLTPLRSVEKVCP